MKKWILIVFMLLIAPGLFAQKYPQHLLMCMNPSGNLIPVNSGIVPGQIQAGNFPQVVGLGSASDGNQYPLQCDTSGNLIVSGGAGVVSGQTVTCLPKASSSSALTGPSSVCDNGTTVTATEPIAAPSLSAPILTVTACSTGQVPRGDGTGLCITPGTGTGTVSGQTNTCLPKASSASALTASSSVCDNGSTVTATEPVAAPSFAGAGTGLTGTAASLTAGHANNLPGDFATQSAATPAAGTFSNVAVGAALPAWMPAQPSGSVIGQVVGGVYSLCSFAGATWGDSLRAALAAIDVTNGGGIIDSSCSNGATGLTTGAGTTPIEIGKNAQISLKLPANFVVLAANVMQNLVTPSAPTVTATGSGGTWPAGTLYVTVNERTGGGVSAQSPETVVTISLNNTVTVTSPACSTYARSYDINMSLTTNTETVQFNQVCGTNKTFSFAPTGSSTFANGLWKATPAAPTSANGLPLFVIHNETHSGIIGAGPSQTQIKTAAGFSGSNVTAVSGNGYSILSGLLIQGNSGSPTVSDSTVFDAGIYSGAVRSNLSITSAANSAALKILGTENDVNYENVTLNGVDQAGAIPLVMLTGAWMGFNESLHSINFNGLFLLEPGDGQPMATLTAKYGGSNASGLSHISMRNVSEESHNVTTVPTGITLTGVNGATIGDLKSQSSLAGFIPIVINGEINDSGNQIAGNITTPYFGASNSTVGVQDNISGVTTSASPAPTYSVAPYQYPNLPVLATGIKQIAGTNLVTNNDFSQGSGGSISGAGGSGTVAKNWTGFCSSGATCVYALDSTNYHSGSPSQSMTVDSTLGHNTLLYSNTFSMTTGLSYARTIWLFTPTSGGTTVNVDVANSTTSTIYCPAQSVTLVQNVWKQIDVSCTSSATGSDARLRVYSNAAVAQAVQINVDDTQAAPLITPTYSTPGSAAALSASGTGPNAATTTDTTNTSGVVIVADGNGNHIASTTQLTSLAPGPLSVQHSTTDTVACPNNTTANFATSYTIPANTITSTTLLRVTVAGTVLATATIPNMAFKLLLGGTTIWAANAFVAPPAGSTVPVGGVFLLAGTAVPGATAAVLTNSAFTSTGSPGAPFSTSANNTISQNAATNGNLVLQPALFCSANTANNGMTLNQLVVEVVHP